MNAVYCMRLILLSQPCISVNDNTSEYQRTQAYGNLDCNEAVIYENRFNDIGN